MTAADRAHENSDSDRNRERDERAMLDLLRQAAQGIVAYLGRVAADFRGCVADGVGVAAKPLDDAAECRRNDFACAIRGMPGGCGSTLAGALEALLKRAQAPLDLADLGRDGEGISGVCKHQESPCSKRESEKSDSPAPSTTVRTRAG